MISKIDYDIGILTYSTSFKGCSGKIRLSNEDFFVSEVLDEKAISRISQDEGYAVYKLKKQGLDTHHALSSIFKKYRLRLKALGLKDANATTEQYVCSINKTKQIENICADRYSLQRIGFVKKPLTKKNMVGNHFKIKIHDSLFSHISEFKSDEKVLNFYGYQRFGSKRAVTHLIGKAILQNNFEDAVDLLLSFDSIYDSHENSEIRQMLKDKTNYSKLIDKVPPQMDLEKIAIREMISSGNPKLAIRALPLMIRRLFVQAYQSYIFNLLLSNAFDYGENLFEPRDGDVCYDKNNNLGIFTNDPSQKLAIPQVGYAYSKKNRFHYHILRILEKEEISAKDFFVREMQEVSSEGGFRQSTIKFENFLPKEPFVSFTLSRGSYATILLREIMKPEDPIIAGF